MFYQEVTDSGEVVEIPASWLEKGNPWELERAEVIYKISMGGETTVNHLTKQQEWHHDETSIAVAYDIPITGFNTFNTNNLRLWRSRPMFGGDDDSEEEHNDPDLDLVDKIDQM